MTSKPNILIIMADQMTAALTGAYGHPVVKTPNLDLLAKQGIRFDAAYSNCPLCTPSRTSMLSGRYISRTRTYDNGAILPSDVPTYAHHLRAAGYETAVSGKMHLVGADQFHGFEKRLTSDIYPTTFKWTPSWDEYSVNGIRNDKAQLLDNMDICEDNLQLRYDRNAHNCALDFISSKRNSDRPFLLLTSYTHPHPPYQIPQEYWDLYEDADIDLPKDLDAASRCRSQMDEWLMEYQGVSDQHMNDRNELTKLRRIYYGMVTYVDRLVGELLQALETAGLKDNTAILFLSDHGDMLCERGFIEKRTFHEWSVRIPMIASFPDRWNEGTVCTEPVSMIDIFPTLTEFVDTTPPIDVDGESFLDYLEKPNPQSTGRVVISEYHGEGVSAPCFMARKGSLKYIYIHGHAPQLFDLSTDPDEIHNLAGDPSFANTESILQNTILDRFNPEAIAADVVISQQERRLMQTAMIQGSETNWAHVSKQEERVMP